MKRYSQIFGHFAEPHEHQESLSLCFSSSRLPVSSQWLNTSLSTDFLAEYWSTFFAPHAPGEYRRTAKDMKHVISFVANELLDNAIKYGYTPPLAPTKILIRISLAEAWLQVYVTNTIHPENIGPFQEYIKKLLTEDPERLYVHHMEQSEAVPDHTVSGLGFLSILHDYCGRLAWKFEVIPQYSDEMAVTTLTYVPVIYLETS